MKGPRNNNQNEDSLCQAMELLLAEYQAGELDTTEAGLVEDHLESCSGCRAELARENLFRQTLSQLPMEVCPSLVTNKILSAIAASPATKQQHWLPRHRSTLLAWAGAAAAAVLIMISPLVRDRSDNGPDPANLAQFTPEEIQTARQEAERGLLLAVRILDRTERTTVKEVFGHTLPNSLSRSIKTIMKTSEGGQG